MAYTVQVVIDSREPHVLAAWWAELLDWDVEQQDEAFIRLMIEQGHASEAETMVHAGSLVWRAGAAINPPEGVAAPRILFQEVSEPKVLKNRVHLDLRGVGDDVESVRAQLIERGATVLHHGRQGPHTWVTMTDPEGNEFCV